MKITLTNTADPDVWNVGSCYNNIVNYDLEILSEISCHFSCCSYRRRNIFQVINSLKKKKIIIIIISSEFSFFFFDFRDVKMKTDDDLYPVVMY